MVAHQFGIESREVEDTYLRLDRDLADFLSFLDQRFGKENVMVFLTADHGGSPNPEYVADHSKKAGEDHGGWLDNAALHKRVQASLAKVEAKDSLLLAVKGHTFYLNRRLAAKHHLDLDSLAKVAAEAAKGFPHARFVLAAAPSVPDEAYAALQGSGITIVKGRTYDVLRQSRAALVTSGTATLETALFRVPEVVCYSSGALNVWIAKRLVDIKYISLVNLIMDREVVRELIQADLNLKALCAELEKLLADGAARDRMLAEFDALREKLGGPGASARVASSVWKSLTVSD